MLFEKSLKGALSLLAINCATGRAGEKSSVAANKKGGTKKERKKGGPPCSPGVSLLT